MKLGIAVRRFFPASSLGQRWLELGVSRVLRQRLTVPVETPPPVVEDDPLDALRRVTCGGAS